MAIASYAAQRIGFYPPCGSMVDKISWAKPLDSARAALGFVMERLMRWELRGAVVCDSRARIGFVGSSPRFGNRREDYDRCVVEGQRRSARQVRLLRAMATQGAAWRSDAPHSRGA